MALVPTLKTWLLVVPALALLGVVGYRAGGHVRHADDMPDSVGETPVALVAAAPMQAQQLARQLLANERGNAIASGLPLDIRADIEGDTDLFAYAQRLQLQAANGNAEASWMISRVYDYCAIYAMDPGGYQLDNALLTGLGMTASPAMVQARERVARRCGGFVASDGLGRQLILTQRVQAATAGNLAAEAALFADGQPLQNSPDYRRGLVERVRESRDPEAFMALAPAMGQRASGDSALNGLVAGDQYSELAWRLGACELGMACGPDSVLMNNFCANGGICSQDGGQDFATFVYDAAVSRQGAGKMKTLVEELIKKRKGR
ncbi:hypothetical protein [Stenotrophomonas sp. 364]|jgi:hypothetical protein|uniref:hypothetical protein n=1 Tax=Stenotrophomonas sp. 364 TaxID=2691571 RepID=UPI00131780B2|nr:hypothetical protein [Stenotrophomonas sp. 364]QHB72999.1 hypothetical protein GQ674_17615 [Stenotrophomonas sp. 364]